MKQMTFLFALSCMATSVTAQSDFWNGEKDNGPVTFEVQTGINLSKFANVERWNNIKPGLNIGVMAEKPIFYSLSVKAGLFYTMKGAKGKNDGGFGGTIETTFSPSYLEIPVMASYRYQITEDLLGQFDLGPYFAYGLHGKNKKVYSGSSVGKDSETEDDVFEYIKRFDCGVRFGPQVVYKNKYSLSLSYEISVTDISDMGDRVGNSNWSISLGYRF